MFIYRFLIYTTVGKYLTKSWFQHFLKDGELDKESLIREMGILEEELFRSERELKFYDDKVNSFVFSEQQNHKFCFFTHWISWNHFLL